MLAKICHLVFVVFTIALFLQSCDTDSGAYFPLEKGLKWRYQVSSVTPHYKNKDTLVIKNMGKRTIDQKDLYVRRTSLGTDYYFVKENLDVRRIAKRTAAELKAEFDEENRYVIKGPLVPGTSWIHAGQPYLLDRPFPTNYELRRIVHFPMTYKIISLDEEVKTKAGAFTNCLHIKGTAAVDIGRILTIAQDEVKFTTDEWYAPGVGLVKLVRFEDVDSKHVYGGTVEMNLVEFRR